MKVKKTKSQGSSSVLSKAVSNVTKIIKKKDKKPSKKEVEKKSLKQKVKLIKKEKPEETIITDTTLVVKKEASKKPPVKKSQVVKKKDSVKSARNTFKGGVKKTPKKKKETSDNADDRKGLVYIGHIPHGFYENEMKEYFEQFGTVTRVRVARSKKTGKSRGYGYIEFKHEDVAKIAAETMNNYLMCGRLLKAHLIPQEKHHRGFFAGEPWSEKIYPKMRNRVKELKKNDSPTTEAKHKKNAKKSLKKLNALEETLKSAGIKIKFKPKNVPQ